jgi:hypothetical protein
MAPKRLIALVGIAVLAAGASAGLFVTSNRNDGGVAAPSPGRPMSTAPAGFDPASPGTRGSGDHAERPRILPTAYPATIDIGRIVITTNDPDSGFVQWMRGEGGRGRIEGPISDEAIEALRTSSDRRVEPDLPLAVGAGRSPSPGTGFDVIDFTEGGTVPPDYAIAVGDDHVIVVANRSIEMLDTSGATVFGPTTAGSFFSFVSGCTSGLYDPDVLFDEEHRRYLIGFDQGAGSTSGGYCLAVSQTADPLGDWFGYFFPVNTTSDWLDYPHMGVGDDYVVVGGNMFNYDSPASFTTSRMWAMAKSDLYAGAGVTAVQEDVPSGLFTPQPLNLHGWSNGSWPSHGGDVYVIADLYDGVNYRLFRWNIPAGTVATVGTANLGAAGFPVDVPQTGTYSIDANDWRSHGFEFRNGYGWTANTIGCDPGGGTVNCVRWAQIDITSGGLGPQGSGTISSAGDHRTFPAVVANACDDMAIGYTRKTSSSDPGVVVSGRLSTDPVGTVGTEIEVKPGEIVYTAFDIDLNQGDDTYRWGDYTGMAIDPDGVTFWYLGEYAKDTGTTDGRWGGYVVPLTYASCTADGIFADGFEEGDTDAWSATIN